MPFFTISQLREELETLGANLTKTRGQCYLIDRNIVNIIEKEAKFDKDVDITIEIGSGLGTISDLIVENSKQAILFETDKKIHNYLESHFLEKNSDNVKILHQDALKGDFSIANKIVANIPYQISAPLIFKIIEQWNFSQVILMVQAEFAERLVATTNSKNYSRISAATQLFVTVEKIKSVSRNCFFPKPKVNSMLIRIKEKENHLSQDHIYSKYREDYLDFLRGIFPYKNKKLNNSVKYYFRRDPGAQEKFSYLYTMLENSEFIKYDIFDDRVRNLDPKDLFKIMLFGIEGNVENLEYEHDKL